MSKRRWAHPSLWQDYWQQPRGGMTQCPSRGKWKTTGVTSTWRTILLPEGRKLWRALHDDIVLSEVSQTRRQVLCWSHTSGFTSTRHREQSNSWRQKKKGRAWGTGEMGHKELLFNGYRVSVLQDEKSSRDWGHNHMDVLSATKLYTQKWSRW